jgi:formylglycine-generating enzyme required for sulfatase activity
MVGNVNEWVADWVPLATLNCRTWELVGINDTACVDGAAASGVPGALVRGGSFRGGAIGGAFAVTGNVTPDSALDNVGFRAAR